MPIRAGPAAVAGLFPLPAASAPVDPAPEGTAPESPRPHAQPPVVRLNPVTHCPDYASAGFR